MSDLRSAFRQLAKAPGFAVVAILTLALCIGANSAIFSVVNAILLKPYPYPDSGRLVYLTNTYPLMGLQRAGVSVPDYLDRRAGVTSLAESAIYSNQSFNLADTGTPEQVNALMASPSLFPMLQVQPFIGRAFNEADAKPGAAKTVVLSYSLWQAHFAGSPSVIGRDIRLNGEPYTVIGVMPAGFYFPSLRAQLWVPFVFTDKQKSDAERGNEYSTMVGRLKPGATIAQAQREADEIQRRNAERLPDQKPFWVASGFGGVVTGFLEQNVEGVRAMLWLLQGGVLAALLIGCANVANLLLARASARERELAIRSALGAGRGRLFRQLITESLVLFLLGGALGLVVALWSVSAMDTFGFAAMPRGYGVQLDTQVFLFTLGCALLTGLAFGALPAWSATRGNAADALKEAGARGTAGRRHLWLRSALVVSEIALSLMLLATAGLLIKSFERLHEVSPGFSPENVLTAQLTLPAKKYSTPEKQVAFCDDLIARMRALPGVTSVGLTSILPFSAANSQGTYAIAGYTQPAGQPAPHGMIRSVSPDYFRALGIPLLHGRLFAAQDSSTGGKVVVIDRVLADRYWPGADPIGQRIDRNGDSKNPDYRTIIGVVAPVKNGSLEENVTKETLYFPLAQLPERNLTLVVKTTTAAGSLVAPVREAVLALDREQPVYDIKTMDARLDDALAKRRAPMLLLGIFSGIALLLAALGVYGVLAFSVGQRRQEIGIRMALGAQRSDILGLILRQGVMLVIIGVALGLAGYFALSRVIGQLLYGVGATDVTTLLLAPLLLAVVALAACLIPARRATRVDPLVALRSE